MKKLNFTFFLLLMYAINTLLPAQYNNTLKIDYFGQEPPGSTYSVFSPDFISKTGVFVQNSCFSQDGKEYFFSKTDNNWSYNFIMYTKYSGGIWSEPVKLFDGLSPALSYDDGILYFISDKIPGSKGADVWVSERNDSGWDEPQKVEYPVSSDGNEWELTISSEGTLYFSSDRIGGYGNMDVYRAELNNDSYTEVTNLGQPINSSSANECPYIAPDESFIIFCDWKTNPQFGNNNLYIAFRKDDGSWTTPLDMGKVVNSNINDIYPYITPDGKNFMFTSRAGGFGATSSKICWVSTSFLDSLKTIATSVTNNKDIREKVSVNYSDHNVCINLKDIGCEKIDIKLFDTFGRLIYSEHTFQNNSLNINTLNHSPGMYIVHINWKQTNASFKVVTN